MLLNLKVNVVWKVSTPHQFNAVTYGRLFQQNDNRIVAVGEDGIVRIYNVPTIDGLIQPVRSLETKCGPLSHVILYDVTRLSPKDMLVADTRGAIVLFCDGQILVRKCSFSGKTSRVTALEVEESKLGHVRVIAGRQDGEVVCFNTFSDLWKLRLTDNPHQNLKTPISVSCILATHITPSTGPGGDYVIVADSNGFIHVVQNGAIMTTLRLNSTATSMAAGRFILEEDADKAKQPTQVAIGCDDGSVSVMVDFNIDTTSPYVSLSHPITKLCRVKAKTDYSSNIPSQCVDFLIVASHSSSVEVLQHGKTIYSIALHSWPVSMCVLDNATNDSSDDNGTSFVLIGCQDSYLQLVSIT